MYKEVLLKSLINKSFFTNGYKQTVLEENWTVWPTNVTAGLQVYMSMLIHMGYLWAKLWNEEFKHITKAKTKRINPLTIFMIRLYFCANPCFDPNPWFLTQKNSEILFKTI